MKATACSPDTSSSRKLLASEARFQRLLDSNIIGIGVTHANGQVLQANDAYLRMLGHTRGELEAGRVWWASQTPPEFLPIDEAAIAEANRSGTCAPYEKEYIRHTDGARVPVQIAFTTLLDQPEQYIVYAVDLTARKRVETELRHANRKKDEFLATLSHELRNPLAPMANSVHVLRKVMPDGADERALGALGIIDRQVRHMTRLVDDLLDMARITRGKVDLRRKVLDLGPVVKHSVDAVRPLIDRLGHRIEVDVDAAPIWVDADPDRVEQMLINLLTNAAKYTDAGGRIALRAHRAGEQAVVRVADNGIGIDPEMLPLVFEPFTQLDPARGHAQGGLGIGLALVHRFAQMHGGSIAAHSAGRGAGSEFILTLPALPEASARAARTGAAG